MRAFIRIVQLVNQFEGYEYQKKIAESQKRDVFFEFDNFSDKQMVKYSLELLKESRIATILIEMKEDAELGYIPFFFRKALSQKEKVELVYEGKNKLMDKILYPFKPKALN